MQELLEDSRVTYIIGNHEQMFLDAFINKLNLTLWFINGGQPTYEAFNKLSEEEQKDLVFQLKSKTLIYYTDIERNLILTHSGFNLDDPEPDFIWDRKHINQNWTQNFDYRDTKMIHGHTMVWTLNKYNLDLNNEEAVAAIIYCDGHKIDIDMGSVITKKICLLDLDTLEPIYFTEEDDENVKNI